MLSTHDFIHVRFRGGKGEEGEIFIGKLTCTGLTTLRKKTKKAGGSPQGLSKTPRGCLGVKAERPCSYRDNFPCSLSLSAFPLLMPEVCIHVTYLLKQFRPFHGSACACVRAPWCLHAYTYHLTNILECRLMHAEFKRLNVYLPCTCGSSEQFSSKWASL